MMKRFVVRTLSYLSHPLLMPTLGLLLIFNSGSYLSNLLNPQAEKAILFVMALGTLIFPLLVFPVLYQRKIWDKEEGTPGTAGRMLPYLVVLVLYVITLVYFMRLPLNRLIHAFMLSTVIMNAVLFAFSYRHNICIHSAGLGGMAGLVLSLMVIYESPLQIYLAAILLMAGLTGSARLWEGVQKPGEVYSGFILGMAVVPTTLMVY